MKIYKVVYRITTGQHASYYIENFYIITASTRQKAIAAVAKIRENATDIRAIEIGEA